MLDLNKSWLSLWNVTTKREFHCSDDWFGWPVPANFFWVTGVRFLYWECWAFLKTTQTYPKFPRDIWSLPKIAGGEATLTFPSLMICIAKHDLTPSAFYLKKEVSLFTHSFHFYIGLSVHIFAKLQPLICKHEQVWDWRFQSAVVIPMPKAWELANLVTSEHCGRSYFIQISILNVRV